MRTTRAIARLAASPGAALFAFVLLAYVYFYQAGGWNQNSRFDLTRAIVERGTASIDAYHANTGDKARLGDHFYCEKAPGVSWLAVPAHALWVAAAGPPSGDRVDAAAYASTVWAVALPSALAVPVLLWLLAMLGCPRLARHVAAAAYALGTLAWPHATLFYGQQPSATLSLTGFALAVAAAQGRLSPRLALSLAGAALGASVMADYPAVLCAIVVGLYAAVRCRRAALWLVAGGAVPAALLAAYHAAVFGGPLELPYEHSLMPYRHQGFFMGLGVPDLAVLREITVSSFRGLFFSSPWLVLAAPGAWRLGRARRAEAISCAAVFLLYLWMNASLVDPYGGWAVGPRFLVPALPFLAVLAGFALARPARPILARLTPALAALAIAYSAAMMLMATSVKPELPLELRHPYGDYLAPSFTRGWLAANTQGIDMVTLPPDGPPRAWNLGHRMGLGGLASLAPLGAAAALAGLWMARTWRREVSPAPGAPA